MKAETLLLVAAAAAFLLVIYLRFAAPSYLSRLKVRPKPLMTQAERRVCIMIERALPGARVHSQVSLGAIMNPARGLTKSEWWTTFNKFSSKRIDFVVEDPETGAVILLVELDDRTHNSRGDRDRDRDELTRHAGFQTVRIPAGRWPTQQSIASLIGDALDIEEALPPLPAKSQTSRMNA